MTRLKQRMIEDLQLRGLSPSTQDAYVRVVRQLAEHYDKPPAEITEEELRQYFLYLTNGKGVSASAFRIALCGIKFFYQYTLKRERPTLDLVRPAKEKKLPVVLSVEEVHQVLGRSPQPDLDIPDHASSRCLLAGGGNQVHGSKFGAKGLEGGCRRERSAQTSYRPHPAAFLCHTSTCPVPGW